MKKWIIIGSSLLIIGIIVSLGTIELEPIQTIPVEESLIINESPVSEESITSESKHISVNLSDGIGAGDR